MAIYVRKNGVLVDKNTGAPMTLPGSLSFFPTPMILGDIEPYLSPIDGRYISGRSARVEDLRRHGCVEYERSMSPTRGKIKNKKFAAKRGLKVSEEYL